jgi:hypothetical protein
VVFSGVFTFLIVWMMYGLIYRWRATRITDEQVEGVIERIAPARIVEWLRGRRVERP